MTVVRALLGRLGHFWYVLPCTAILLAGIGTCGLIDVTDPDRFTIEASVADRTGLRSAVLARQYHADSGATVRCVWIVGGSGPGPGPSRRLAQDCAAIATSPDVPIRLDWRPNGRLVLTLQAATTVSPLAAARDSPCYFHAAKRPDHVCYRDEIIDIARQ